MATLQYYIAFYLALGKISECAKNGRDAKGFIFGSEYTTIDKFPHAVYLAVLCHPEQKLMFICGGSIVNQRLIITAAHCIYMCDPNTDSIYSRVGHENMKKASAHKVLNFICHEKFAEGEYTNDIALATVEPLRLGDKVKRIVIPDRYPQNAGNKIAKAAGWGIHGEESGDVNLLKSVDRVLREFETCNKILGSALQIGALCAGEIGNHHPKTAYGDSGSGLIYNSTILLGIVSYDVNDHLGLEVYTNVTYFHDWIMAAAETLYCEILNISDVTTALPPVN